MSTKQNSGAIAVMGFAFMFFLFMTFVAPLIAIGLALYSCTDLKDQVPALIEEFTDGKE